MNDLISRQDAINVIAGIDKYFVKYIQEIPSAEPEIVRCEDCKHRPYKSEDQQGFGVEFPDEICPCQCEDGWYNWRPDDDWFCANADMRGDTE